MHIPDDPASKSQLFLAFSTEPQGSGAALEPSHAAAEQAVRATFAHAGQYIALAYILQPSKAVYADSLAAVQRLLPLPFLRLGKYYC